MGHDPDVDDAEFARQMRLSRGEHVHVGVGGMRGRFNTGLRFEEAKNHDFPPEVRNTYQHLCQLAGRRGTISWRANVVCASWAGRNGGVFALTFDKSTQMLEGHVESPIFLPRRVSSCGAGCGAQHHLTGR